MFYKKIIFCALIAFQTGAFAQKSKIDSVFSQLGRRKDITSINISRPMFGMLGKLSLKDADMKDLKPMLDKIKSLKILVVEQPANNISSSLISTMKSLNYDELMSVNNEGEQIKFLSAKAENGLLHDVLLHISSGEENVFMLLEGDMTIDDLNRFSSEVQKSDRKNSEAQTSSERVVEAFQAIETASGTSIVLTQGSTQKVVVDAGQDEQKYVNTVVENGVLKIRIDRPSGKSNNDFNRIKIYVTMPELQMLTLNSGSTCAIEDIFRTKDLVLRLDAGSLLKGKLDVKNLSTSLDSGSSLKIEVNTSNFALDADSGSTATVTGISDNSSIILDSGSTANMLNFETKNSSVKLSSGSSARISVSESLAANVESGASLSYRGNPTNIVVNKQSASSSITHLEK